MSPVATRADSLSALVVRLQTAESYLLECAGEDPAYEQGDLYEAVHEAVKVLLAVNAATETTATAACIRCGVPMDEQVVRANHTIAYLMERCETAESARLAAPEAQPFTREEVNATTDWLKRKLGPQGNLHKVYTMLGAYAVTLPAPARRAQP